VVSRDQNLIKVGSGGDDWVEVVKGGEDPWVVVLKEGINSAFDDADGVGRLLVEVVSDFFENVVGDVVGWIPGDYLCTASSNIENVDDVEVWCDAGQYLYN